MKSPTKALYPYLPRGVQQALLVRARSPLWIDRGIVFVHIPKAAGTSINQALYGRFMGHPRAVDIERFGSARLRRVPRFSVSRNPWDRLLSAYRFAVHGALPGSPAAIWKPQRYRIPEFESFERFVMEWLARRDVRRLDFIFQPQSRFVCDARNRLLVDHVGRLENLEPTFAFVEKVIGEPLQIPWENSSGERVEYREFYSAQMAKVVGDIYHDDVAAFGYSF